VDRIAVALEEAAPRLNGPLGAFETPPFEQATVAVAKKLGTDPAGKLLSVAAAATR